MPVIVLASPKGGVGKSTISVLLATRFARMGADVTALDCDPNRSLSMWAARGVPPNITVQSDLSAQTIIRAIKAADGRGRAVIVDLEGVASHLVSRAMLQADLVIVPMQATALDAAMGVKALNLVREEEEALDRPIRYAVALTRTSPVKTRIHRQLESELRRNEIDVIDPPLVQRTAYTELFAFGGDLESLAEKNISTSGNIAAAIANAYAFSEAVYDRLA